MAKVGKIAPGVDIQHPFMAIQIPIGAAHVHDRALRYCYSFHGNY